MNIEWVRGKNVNSRFSVRYRYSLCYNSKKVCRVIYHHIFRGSVWLLDKFSEIVIYVDLEKRKFMNMNVFRMIISGVVDECDDDRGVRVEEEIKERNPFHDKVEAFYRRHAARSKNVERMRRCTRVERWVERGVERSIRQILMMSLWCFPRRIPPCMTTITMKSESSRETKWRTK